MQQYFLARHAFVCTIGPDVIVLDLRRDEYFSFEREFWEPIARMIGIAGTQAIPDGATDGEPGDAADAGALEQLLERGLLTEDGSDGKDASPATIELPCQSMMEDFRARRPAIRVGHILVFLGAIVTALFRRRFQPMEKIVASVTRHRQREHQDADPSRTRDLTEIFRRLRPLLFTSRDQCVLESLMLIHFLAHYRVHPSWVFGVQTMPFLAHCWLQQGPVACNDTLDYLRRYTPIMVA